MSFKRQIERNLRRSEDAAKARDEDFRRKMQAEQEAKINSMLKAAANEVNSILRLKGRKKIKAQSWQDVKSGWYERHVSDDYGTTNTWYLEARVFVEGVKISYDSRHFPSPLKVDGNILSLQTFAEALGIR